MAQSTFNAHSSSGHVENSDANWTTCRDGATGTAVVTTGGDNFIVGELNGTYAIYRGFYKFDTSALDDGAIISSAQFKVYLTAKDTTDDFTLVVTGHTAADTTLTTAEFDSLTKNTPTEFATRTSVVSGISTGAYITFTLNASGLAAINLAGYTKIALRNEHDVDNITPTARSYAGFDESDDSNPPQLVVNYELPTPGGYIYQSV